MIEFGFQRNMTILRNFMNDPMIYRRSANDSAPSIEDFEPENKPGLDYVMACDDGEPIALFAVKTLPERTAEIHFCFKPSRWGHTQSTCEKFLKWIWKHSKFDVLVGPIPGYNRLALKLVDKLGFERIGLVEKAGTKRGKPFDVIVTGIVRPS